MSRYLPVLIVALANTTVRGQYPLTRAFTARDGQQGVQATCLAQDSLGLLWLGGPRGLFRTDGDRTDAVLRTENDAVTAVCGTEDGAFAALASGRIVRCVGTVCDTLWTDTLLRATPVRSLAIDARGGLWAGTHGGGVRLWHGGRAVRLAQQQGLADDHVNALCVAGDDRMAIATDNGIVVMDTTGRRIAVLGEEQGAPDNLVLALCRDPDGRVWAGTDRGGVFSFGPEYPVRPMEVLGPSGTVHHLAATHGRLWLGMEGEGVVVCDRPEGMAWYRSPEAEQGGQPRVTALLRDRDGAVWWCDGGAVLHRADPNVLIVTAHEGHDLRHVTAIAALGGHRVAIANGKGVLIHASTFREDQRLRAVPLPIDSTTAITALRADAGGNLWAGTFGRGLFRIDTAGNVHRCDAGPDRVNAHVMAVRTAGDTVWAATLDGVFRLTRGPVGACQGRKVPIPGSGFTYDLLPLRDGTVLVATDGNGVIRIARDGIAHQLRGASAADRTFHSFCVDGQGQAWTCGPATGVYRVDPDRLTPIATDADMAMNEVFGFAAFGDGLFLFGDGGAFLIDPATGRTRELTNALALRGAQAELNTVVTDGAGVLWAATDRGLYRLSPPPADHNGRPIAAITAVRQGADDLPVGAHARISAGHDHITFRFTGIHYDAPEDLRFAYRMTGIDTLLHVTRDREISFPRLRPGEHRFEVYAFTERGPYDAVPATFTFTLARPWWQRPWAIALGVGVLGLIGYTLVRLRDGRLRARDRVAKAEAEMGREKARFEMRVLRSQVNPHFLFNSFNTLIALIEEAPAKAVEHVEQLSDFFREILQARDKELIPLREELRLVQVYFAMEQRRFGDRIALRTHVPPGDLDAEVPPLTVQLLVENALKHNRATEQEPLVVEVSAEKGTLIVSNPFRPRDQAVASTGFGLESIAQRFVAITPRPVRFGRENGNFVARIPLLPPAHEDPDRG